MNHPTAAELCEAFAGRRVLVTGHTGFKGAWLALWLADIGAEVTGLALAPEQPRGVFLAADVGRRCDHRLGNVRNLDGLVDLVDAVRPECVFHLAAQSLVRRSYQQPVETVATNVLGTAHVLDAVRRANRPCAVVIVTSDKCYANRESSVGYHEGDPMGGDDLYSVSKGAAELLAHAWRHAFFHPARLAEHGVAVCSARAGNVIGGGDWAADRIVPDAIGALAAGRPVPVRNPDAVRPWQHVLEPVGGYLLLGARLLGVGAPDRAAFCEGWNFGPLETASRPVRDLADAVVRAWGGGRWDHRREANPPHEAHVLRLDVEKARARLGWTPRWDFEESVHRTVEWYRAQHGGAGAEELRALCLRQVAEYLEA